MVFWWLCWVIAIGLAVDGLRGPNCSLYALQIIPWVHISYCRLFLAFFINTHSCWQPAISLTQSYLSKAVRGDSSGFGLSSLSWLGMSWLPGCPGSPPAQWLSGLQLNPSVHGEGNLFWETCITTILRSFENKECVYPCLRWKSVREAEELCPILTGCKCCLKIAI